MPKKGLQRTPLGSAAAGMVYVKAGDFSKSPSAQVFSDSSVKSKDSGMSLPFGAPRISKWKSKMQPPVQALNPHSFLWTLRSRVPPSKRALAPAHVPGPQYSARFQKSMRRVESVPSSHSTQVKR